jgi:hypothetical protein
MVARLMPAQESMKLTRENHPENSPVQEKEPTLTLGASIGISVVSALAGATLGSAALSTAFLVDTPWHVASLIPMVAAGVSILGGWIGAFFWMCREEAAKHRE